MKNKNNKKEDDFMVLLEGLKKERAALIREMEQQDRRIEQLKEMKRLKDSGTPFSDEQKADIEKIKKKMKRIGVFDKDGNIAEYYRPEE